MTNRRITRYLRVGLLIGLVGAVVGEDALAYTLWSTDDLRAGPGTFYGPGDDRTERKLFPVVVRNISFQTASDAIVPFINSGSDGAGREACEPAPAPTVLSNGLAINRNISACAGVIGGRKVVAAVVDGGQHRGRQITTFQTDGDIVVTADLALDFGDRRVVRFPLYATTGTVTVPRALADGGRGKRRHDRAGKYAAGATVRGRVGDFNGDGWIDGTLVAVGVMPPDSPVGPGQPFVIIRNFETNIPINGVLSGNIRALDRTSLAQ